VILLRACGRLGCSCVNPITSKDVCSYAKVALLKCKLLVQLRNAGVNANYLEQPVSRRWKAFRYSCLCLTNGTGLTGSINFTLPATSEQARCKAYHKIAVATSDPRVKVDPFNVIIIIIKPYEQVSEDIH
jgi:hypothetical protein